MSAATPPPQVQIAVRADFETVLEVLRERALCPERFSAEVTGVVLQEVSPHRWHRSSNTGGVPLEEEVELDPGQGRLRLVLRDHPLLQGDIVWHASPEAATDGTTRLTLQLRWQRREQAGWLPMLDTLQQALLDTKYEAERRAPDFVLVVDERPVAFASETFTSWEADSPGGEADSPGGGADGAS
jgi:hypothetical protein